MTRKNIPLALAVLTLSASALAVDVDVKFRADIIQPTCDIKLEGTGTSKTGTDAYKLVIPDIRLDQLRAKSAETVGEFTLKTENCTGSPSKIVSTIMAEKKTGIAGMNLAIPLATGAGLTGSIGVGFRRASTSTDTFFKVQNDEKITWTANEITKDGLKLAAVMRETQTDKGTIGDFSAKVTFNFTYE
ncbi:fimbrial protein [Escherichia marmotae]|uniref:Fimbrial protein n=1 Tax=Escherichia marmotae TaxID=1499973 RepID=A0A7L6L4Z6_9ESCH|nr:fimbrial protein [Escherichia marmotae]MEC9604571.1 fimbrial protein [Escherichia marmotae]MED0235499.1 fimbrial protein [Escherichia marmotae]MED0542001.1 fimbrial protein [Escherichia marmotae]MED8763052.1 fimbrial protein [Escherichia marmotae]MED8803529.1 fimbrial protein [Escherichia marmotae]